MTLKQATQANKKFLTMIEERGGAAHSVSSLERALDGPIDFVIELRLKISALLDDGAWTSKETRIWSGISRNLQPVCREEEREMAQRSQENKLFQLELRILDLPEKISRPGRYLIHAASINASTLTRTGSPTPSTSARQTPSKLKWIEMEAILANDCMLLLKKSKRHKGMFDFKSQIYLNQLAAADNSSFPTDLRLTTHELIHTLRFESPIDADKWYSEIKQHLPEAVDQPTGRSELANDLEDCKSGSDPEEGDSKKRKKRSTSSMSNDSKGASLKFSDPRPSIEAPKPRTSTESKRSTFTKSLSVSTITSDVSDSASRHGPRRISKQRTIADSSTHDVPSDRSLFSSTFENGSQKRRRSAKTPDAPNVSAASTTPLPPLSPLGSLHSQSSSRIDVPRLPLGFSNHTATSPPPARSSPTLASDSISQKYPARLSRVLDRLEGSSDYEESEDEPKRHFAPISPFVKPGLRDSSLARNLQSSSVRELRSGSIDDLSAREPSHSVGSSNSPSSRGTTPTPHHSNTTPNLPVELVISTISRMETDLALLKKLLADSGVVL